ncbi:MAG: 16S rRNA (guanine(527)-N(7))-methyltransferase RsmG [Bacteroidales bacterium]|nr:16S rRNA (guanine(527)-N(7))-methyltransferase RsmG [Bacteroidales bacterium]
MPEIHSLPLIEQFFPELSDLQKSRLGALPELYKEWNAKINVISRKDIDHIEAHHILHSLGIAKFTRFPTGVEVLDIGTGGGFPGIPLAILFPEAHFTLVDGTGKKIKVVQAVSDAVGLENVTAIHTRAEDLPGDICHFIVSRGALPMPDLYRFGQKLIHKRSQNKGAMPNGIIALKGGDLREELLPFKRIVSSESLEDLFPGLDFFKEKKVIYLPV